MSSGIVLERQEAVSELEIKAIQRFHRENADLFKKDDRQLFKHLGVVIGLLILFGVISIACDTLWIEIPAGVVLSLLYFSLINVTIHHHLTHRNAAESEFSRRALDLIYKIVLPQAGKRKSRYVKVHLSHHAAVYEPTDVDHLYGVERYLQMQKTLIKKAVYFLELTFIGAHVPGWEDDNYMNQTPRNQWNLSDYRDVKKKEWARAWRSSALQWIGFALALWIFPWIAWVWAFPMLLVKNWAHFLGQFQHYDERLLDPKTSAWRRTKSYKVPAWFNYLLAGEIRGHYLHHLFPTLPYYRMNEACRRFLKDNELTRLFVVN